jgi:uncharacterized protein (TIGR03086 family)
MKEQDIFIIADQTLNNVVSQIKDDQWNMTMPPEFYIGGDQKQVTLRELINYHAYDDAWVPDMLAGKTMEEAGKENYKGDLLKDDPKGNFAMIVEKACKAAHELADLDQTVHCSFGDFKANEYLWQANYFRGIRAHDIAHVIGADSMLPDDLVKGLWEELSPQAEAWRAIGVFGPKVDVPNNASLQDKLLALTGRRP